MKSAALAFGLKAAITGSALLVAASALAQQAQPPSPTGSTGQPSTVRGAVPSSNPWDSLPAMSPYRCLAEFVGTATDPNTGAPVRASVNPETGRPLCSPSSRPTERTTPPRH